MKSSTLIALHEAHELPEHLLLTSDFSSPIEDAEKEVNNTAFNRYVSISLFTIGAMSLLCSTVLYSSNSQSLETARRVFIVLFSFLTLFSIACAIVTWYFYHSEPLSEFGSKLEQLREALGLSYGEMRAMTIEDLRDQAKEMLREQANRTKELQGPNGEHSLSKEAKDARDKYENMHTILATFYLCEKEWNKYWETPEPEREKEAPLKT